MSFAFGAIFLLTSSIFFSYKLSSALNLKILVAREGSGWAIVKFYGVYQPENGIIRPISSSSFSIW